MVHVGVGRNVVGSKLFGELFESLVSRWAQGGLYILHGCLCARGGWRWWKVQYIVQSFLGRRCLFGQELFSDTRLAQ